MDDKDEATDAMSLNYSKTGNELATQLQKEPQPKAEAIQDQPKPQQDLWQLAIETHGQTQF